jgi:hypothetical protein
MSCSWADEHNLCISSEATLAGYDKVNLMTDFVPHQFVARNRISFIVNQ